MAANGTTQGRAVIGTEQNFWLHSNRDNRFDLRRPDSSSANTSPRLDVNTTTAPITIDPSKTALVIIDMQNFFLSPSLGRKQGAGHAAAVALEKHAIPAARKAGIRIIWLNWGLTDSDITNMPPGIKRAFGFEVVVDPSDGEIESTTEQAASKTVYPSKDPRLYKGLGTAIGPIDVDGRQVDAGRLLMRDQWNTDLYPPFDAIYASGKELRNKPDVWIHKDRMSGLWGARTDCEDFLNKEGITTLLFSGVNTDQCVCGSLTDAFSKGFDCVMLRDGCGTTSPEFAQESVEFNAAKTWGFVCACKDLVRGVEAMGKP